MRPRIWIVYTVHIESSETPEPRHSKNHPLGWACNRVATVKTLEGHAQIINSVFVLDNIIISCASDNTIRITQITLYPTKLNKFRSVINSYWLPRYLDQEIIGSFGAEKIMLG